MMKSFDGTMISVNYFPALDLTAGRTAPTILNGPSLATAGYPCHLTSRAPCWVRCRAWLLRIATTW